MQKVHICIQIAPASKLAKLSLQAHHHKAACVIPDQKGSRLWLFRYWTHHTWVPPIQASTVCSSMETHASGWLNPLHSQICKETLEQLNAPFQFSSSGGSRHMHECESEHMRKMGVAEHTWIRLWFLCIWFMMVKAPPNTSQQRLTNREPLLVTRYSNFLHRYCDLSFRKLHSLVKNLYDLQYLLLAGAHRWSASTPDWQYAASNAEQGCVTSIKVENRTKNIREQNKHLIEAILVL